MLQCEDEKVALGHCECVGETEGEPEMLSETLSVGEGAPEALTEKVTVSVPLWQPLTLLE